MIWPQSSLLLAPRVSTDLALPGSKYYRVIPHLCGIPAVWTATEIQSEVSTHSESEKGANTWVLAIHAAVLSGLTTTAAYLPCQQKLLSKHSPLPVPSWFVPCHIHGAAVISTCILCAEGPNLKPSWSLVWQQMGFEPTPPLSSSGWCWWSSEIQVKLRWRS